MMERLKSKAAGFKRSYIQLLTAVLYNCHITGFVNGRIYKGKTKGICVPGLNCYSCPGAVAACPVGSLQSAMATSTLRFPLFVLGSVILFGILLGRMICGFLCPFGFIQELIYKIPLPKIRKNRATKILSYLKIVILIIFVIMIPLLDNVPGFCKYICPAGTLEAGIPLVIADKGLQTMIGKLFTWKAVILTVVLLLIIVCYRGFCRFLCPLGAFYSVFNPVAFFGISVDDEKCTGCNACINSCLMDVSRVGDHECIHCGACMKSCPEGAIRYCIRK